MSNKRFIDTLERTKHALHHEYEKWQYSEYKPKGIEEVVDSILDAKHKIEDIIDAITND